MTTYEDFESRFDFSLIEVGIQTHFVSTDEFAKPPADTDAAKKDWTPEVGTIPIFTALEAAVFQKHRPRVALDLNSIAPSAFPPKQQADDRGILRNMIWKAGLSFHIVTKADYFYHKSLRAKVAAICSEIAPMVANTSLAIGVNQFTKFHQIIYVQDNGQDTTITPEDGCYKSNLQYQIQFAWRNLPS